MSDIDIKFGEHKSHYEELQKELETAKSDLFAKEIETGSPICDFGEGKDRTFTFKCLDFKKYDRGE